MNTRNTIEKIFLKKKEKNLPHPGAKSQVLIITIILYMCWTRLSFADRKNLVTLRPGDRREEGYVIATTIIATTSFPTKKETKLIYKWQIGLI